MTSAPNRRTTWNTASYVFILIACFLCACNQQDKTSSIDKPIVQDAAVNRTEDKDAALNEQRGVGGTARLSWSIAFVPDHPTSSDMIKAIIKSDSILPLEISYKYVWSVNRHVIENVTGDSLPNEYFKKNDVVLVMVKASAGETGTYYQSRSVVIVGSKLSLDLKVLSQQANDAVDMQLLGSDPDGDKIVYALEQPILDGMTIEKESGKITWKAAKREIGIYKFAASATTADGRKATRIFEFTLDTK